MKKLLKPLSVPSLKEVFIDRFEELILSGQLEIGQKLPSERELALELGVSRPVVHEGLVELASRGLVAMRPRVGTVVNDYRQEGSLALLTSLFNYRKGSLKRSMLEDMLALRHLIEVETARQAARNRSDEDLACLSRILAREQGLSTIGAVVRVDFEFHHRVALASGNVFYPMLLKSCEPAYTTFSGLFFQDEATWPTVFSFHVQLVEAISGRDERRAAHVMEQMLSHGKDQLYDSLNHQTTEPLI